MDARRPRRALHARARLDLRYAIATAREFLADAGTSAAECFGSPKLLRRRAQPADHSATHREWWGLREGLGLLGLLGFMVSALPLVQGEPVSVDLPTLSMFAVVIIGAMLIPTFLSSLVRVRPRRLDGRGCRLAGLRPAIVLRL
ncbi:hypothetical protein [Cryobacterium sp. Y62]|uniref:hypothetical protein n=1 Tax=Cryobacterium sp. Y62 TaxID=2048284 RepID=UPI000CE3FC9B|nr:hypothetical protein [Cryobacterium sp. Y62]